MNRLTFDGFLFYLFWGSMLTLAIGVFGMIGEWYARRRGR
jgi:NADH:ubiquinone oxidoreductase subunit 4 (subunit M)